MPRMTLPLAAATAGILIASAAFADNATGTVSAVDTTKHTVTFDDGSVYTTTPTMNLDRIQAGYVLKLSFNKNGATNMVTALEILSPVQPSGY